MVDKEKKRCERFSMIEINDYCFLHCFDSVSWVTGKTSVPQNNPCNYVQRFSTGQVNKEQPRGNWLTKACWKIAIKMELMVSHCGDGFGGI